MTEFNDDGHDGSTVPVGPIAFGVLLALALSALAGGLIVWSVLS